MSSSTRDLILRAYSSSCGGVLRARGVGGSVGCTVGPNVATSDPLRRWLSVFCIKNLRVVFKSKWTFDLTKYSL